MTISNAKKKYIQLLQVISAFAVVVLHSNCFGSFGDTIKWKSANFIECLFYYAVPIFFMISGATLVDFPDRYNIKTFWSKRIQKSIIPYVAWSIIAILYRFVFQNITTDVIVITPQYILERLLKSDALPIYWFFPYLFSMYLSFPMIAYLEKETRQKVLKYLVYGGFIVNILVPFIIKLFHLSFAWPYKIEVVTGYLLYTAAGAYFSHETLQKKSRIGIYILAVIGFLTHFIGTQILSIQEGKIVDFYKGYTNLPTVLYSFGVFVFIKQTGDTVMTGRIEKYVEVLSRYTFPCYLIHWFVLDLMVKFSGLNTQSYWYRLLIPFATYAVVMVISWIIRKVPIIRKILP